MAAQRSRQMTHSGGKESKIIQVDHIKANRIWEVLFGIEAAFPHCFCYSSVIIGLSFDQWDVSKKSVYELQEILSEEHGLLIFLHFSLRCFEYWHNGFLQTFFLFFLYERKLSYYLVNSVLFWVLLIIAAVLDFNKYRMCLLQKNSYITATATTYPQQITEIHEWRKKFSVIQAEKQLSKWKKKKKSGSFSNSLQQCWIFTKKA